MPTRCRPTRRSPRSARSTRRSASSASTGTTAGPWRSSTTSRATRSRACPDGGNTADITGFASRVIEDNLSEGTIALFLQGCGGDINPVFYKDVDHPRDAEPLGNMLGLSTLRAVQEDPATRDDAPTEGASTRRSPCPGPTSPGASPRWRPSRRGCVQSLKGTSLNLKTFLPLVVKYSVSGEFPSYYSHRLPAREGHGPGRPRQARRREPEEHEAVHQQHPYDGGADAAADEPGPAAEAPGEEPRRGQEDRRRRAARPCASATSCWPRSPAS